MPATERAFSEVPPTSLYVDTDVVLDYFVAARPRHALAEACFLRLEDCGVSAESGLSPDWAW